MARIRSIHPGIFTDEGFMALTMEMPLAAVLLPGLWVEADDEGVFEWKPLTLKARLLPATTVDVGAILEALVLHRFIMRFEIGGKSYGAIRNFCKWQRPKKPNSIHPKTPEVRNYVGISPSSEAIGDTTSSEPVPHQFGTGSEKSPQREDGGCNIRQDGKAAPEAENSIEVEIGQAKSDAASPRKADKRGSRIPADWKPGDTGREFARSAGIPERDIDRHAAEFLDYWSSVSGTKGVKLDWLATWRNRCRDIAERKGYRPVMGAPTGMSGSPVPAGWPDRMPPPDACFSAWSRGSWPGAWGAEPGEPGCRVPPDVITEWRSRMAKAA